MSGSKQILNTAFIKSSKAIIQNLKNVSEVDKQLFERALAIIDKDPIAALRIIQTNQQCQALLDDHMLEFNTWKESFNHVVKELNKNQELGNFNIEDKLISLQPKIKAKVPHNSYSSLLISVVKKDLKFDEQFLSKWREQKKKMKQERSKKFQLQKLKKKQIKQKQTQKTPPKQQQKLQIKSKQQIKVKQPPIKSQQSVPNDQKQKRQKFLKQKQSIQQQKKLKQEKQQQKQPQQQKIKQDNKLQQTKQKQIQLKLQKQKDLERQKKLQQKFQSIMKLKNYNEMRFKKNKQFRFNSLIKYLQSRKQFNFNTTKEVAKQIILNVDKFMKDKVEAMLRVSKTRLPGYVNEQAGDLFRMYSSKSTQIQIKNAILLPQSGIKILKLQYPSKSQQYLKLRVQQQYQQEKLHKQFNQTLQSSKKANKIIQAYTLPQQKQNIHQFKVDPGPKKRERLLVSQQSIQYIIQNDSWFFDSFAMQRTFYHLPYETDN